MNVSEPLIQAPLLGEALENGPAAAFVADEDGRYVAVNPAACILTGYTREELLGLRMSDLARYEEAADEYQAMQTSGSRVGTSTLTRKDGSTVEFTYVAGATQVAGMSLFLAVGSAA